MRSPGSDSLRDVTKIGSFDYHGAVSRYDLPADVIDQVEDEFDVICEQFDLEDELTTLAAELPQAPTETLFDFPAVPKNPIKDSLAETLSSLGNSKRRLKEESFNNGLSSFTDSSARQLARKIAVDFERANPHQQSASSINANTPPKSRALLQLEKKVSELRRQFEQKEREVEALELKISDCPSQSKEYKLLMHKLAKVGAQFDQTEKRLQKAIQQLSLSR